MKPLGISRLATATLRARKREYAGLALGIMLAIALVFTLLFAGMSQYAQIQADWRARVGEQDAIVFDTSPADSQAVRDLAGTLGQVVVIAQTEEQIHLGYYDAAAQELLARRLLAGRMPETADEIALDRGALAQLRLGEDLGQTLQLNLSPISASLAQPLVQRSFVLVGILMDQQPAQPNSFSLYSHLHTLPGALLAAQPPLTGSRAVVHWVIKLAPGAGIKALQDRLNGLGLAGHAESYLLSPARGADPYVYILFFAVLCLALLLCAVIAIFNVFSNRLKQREQQIGMLRAVGATRRQIRLIYGQEALLIAVLTAPLAILLSLAAAKLLLLATTKAPLVVPPLLIPLGLAVSLLVVLLSAAWPLRRASRLSPIRVIRDADWMLAHRRMKVKSQARFKPDSLLAARHLRLHRRSTTGASLLIALCMAVLCLLSILPDQLGGTRNLDTAPKPGFRMYRNGGIAYAGDVSINSRAQGLRAYDLAQVAALPGVSRISWTASNTGLLVLEKPGSYLQDAPSSSLYELKHLPSFMEGMFTREEEERMLRVQQENQARTQQALGTGDAVLRVDIKALDPAQLAALAPYITAGSLDLERISQGLEWLVFAPDLYSYQDEAGSQWTLPFLAEDRPWQKRFVNDAFHAGDMLDLRQLYVFSDEFQENTQPAALHAQAHQTRAQRPVGALIDGPAPKALGDFQGLLLVSTIQGMEAMGLYERGPDQVYIYLSATPDQRSEEWLHQQLVGLSLRDPEMSVHNTLKNAREQALSRLQALALFTGLLAVFFALCLSLINNSLTGRLQADRRAIGSLRALGADSKVLNRVYGRQLLLMLCRGVLPGLMLCLCILLWQGSKRLQPFSIFVYALVAALQLALVALMFAFSALHLRRRLSGLLKQPIIAQIREIG